MATTRKQKLEQFREQCFLLDYLTSISELKGGKGAEFSTTVGGSSWKNTGPVRHNSEDLPVPPAFEEMHPNYEFRQQRTDYQEAYKYILKLPPPTTTVEDQNYRFLDDINVSIRDSNLLESIPKELMNSLQPYVKVYKVVYPEGSAAKPTLIRFPFNNFKEGSLEKGEFPGHFAVGIKSFTLDYVGTNPAEVDTFINGKLRLYFNSVEAFKYEYGLDKVLTDSEVKNVEAVFGTVISQQQPAEGAEATTTDPHTHKIERGDTLTSLAKYYGVTLQGIKNANSQLEGRWGNQALQGFNYVKPGEEVTIPAGWSTPQSRPSTGNLQSAENVSNENPHIKKTISFSDLIRRPLQFIKNDEKGHRIYNPSYFRIKVEIGYEPPNENFLTEVIKNELTARGNTGESIQNFKSRLLNSIKEAKLSLYLNLFRHKIDVKSDIPTGAFELEIDYVASAEAATVSGEMDLFGAYNMAEVESLMENSKAAQNFIKAEEELLKLAEKVVGPGGGYSLLSQADAADSTELFHYWGIPKPTNQGLTFDEVHTFARAQIQPIISGFQENFPGVLHLHTGPGRYGSTSIWLQFGFLRNTPSDLRNIADQDHPHVFTPTKGAHFHSTDMGAEEPSAVSTSDSPLEAYNNGDVDPHEAFHWAVANYKFWSDVTEGNREVSILNPQVRRVNAFAALYSGLMLPGYFLEGTPGRNFTAAGSMGPAGTTGLRRMVCPVFGHRGASLKLGENQIANYMGQRLQMKFKDSELIAMRESSRTEGDQAAVDRRIKTRDARIQAARTKLKETTGPLGDIANRRDRDLIEMENAGVTRGYKGFEGKSAVDIARETVLQQFEDQIEIEPTVDLKYIEQARTNDHDADGTVRWFYFGDIIDQAIQTILVSEQGGTPVTRDNHNQPAVDTTSQGARRREAELTELGTTDPHLGLAVNLADIPGQLPPSSAFNIWNRQIQSERAFNAAGALKIRSELKVVLGNLKYVDTLDGKEKSVSLAKFPVSYRSYTNFLMRNIVESKKEKYYLKHFIRDALINLVIMPLNDTCNLNRYATKYYSPVIEYGVVPHGASKHLNIRIDQAARSSAASTTVTFKENPGAENNFPELVSRFDCNNIAYTVNVEKGKNVYTSGGSATGMDEHVMFVGVQVESKDKWEIFKNDKQKDLKNGILYLEAYKEGTPLYKINFTRVDQPWVMEARGEKSSTIREDMLGEFYNCEFQVVGNTTLKAGKYVHIVMPHWGSVNNDVKLDNTTNEVRPLAKENVSLSRRLGIGGYYFVYKSNHRISATLNRLEWKTTAFCKWNSSGKYVQII